MLLSLPVLVATSAHIYHYRKLKALNRSTAFEVVWITFAVVYLSIYDWKASSTKSTAGYRLADEDEAAEESNVQVTMSFVSDYFGHSWLLKNCLNFTLLYFYSSFEERMLISCIQFVDTELDVDTDEDSNKVIFWFSSFNFSLFSRVLQ